jgi:hypothetical protein
MLLHPNLKSFQVIPDKKEHAVSLIKLQLSKLIDPLIIQPMLSTITNNKNNIQVRKKVHSTNTLDEIFDTPISDNNIQQKPNDKTELDRYLEDETRIDNSTSILTYWNCNKSLYPDLARIAKRILTIPATNTSIERLFSDSGNIITDRRTRLDTDKINSLLFIKKNMRILKEIYPSVVEVCKKRKLDLSSVDSTHCATSTKKLKFTTENQELNEDSTEEDDDNEQLHIHI